MIEITKRHDEKQPLGMIINGHFVQKITLRDAKELRMQLNDAIEWAVNMDDLRRENEQSNVPHQARRDSGVALDAIVGNSGGEE